jgi:hypothetical protein
MSTVIAFDLARTAAEPSSSALASTRSTTCMLVLTRP